MTQEKERGPVAAPADDTYRLPSCAPRIEESLNAVIAERNALKASLSSTTRRLAEAVTLLKQAGGIIVEFGDLNGFRNLSNNDLGALVIATATAIGEFLNEVAPVTEAEKEAVYIRRAAAALDSTKGDMGT